MFQIVVRMSSAANLSALETYMTGWAAGDMGVFMDLLVSKSQCCPTLVPRTPASLSVESVKTPWVSQNCRDGSQTSGSRWGAPLTARGRYTLFNRPGVAGAVLQSPLSLIHWLSESGPHPQVAAAGGPAVRDPVFMTFTSIIRREVSHSPNLPFLYSFAIEVWFGANEVSSGLAEAAIT